jgi:hypothetical protein
MTEYLYKRGDPAAAAGIPQNHSKNTQGPINSRARVRRRRRERIRCGRQRSRAALARFPSGVLGIRVAADTTHPGVTDAVPSQLCPESIGV